MKQHLKSPKNESDEIQKPKINWADLPSGGKARKEFLNKVAEDTGNFAKANHSRSLSKND